jgi:hypothetical protein
LRQRAVALFAIVVSFQVPSLAIPAIRVARKEEGRRSYSLPSASGDHVPAHRSPTPFQCRGCELLLVLLGPRGAFTDPCRPLTFSWLPEGTPDQPLCRSIRCPSRVLRPATEIHLRAEGPHVALPVKAGRAKARERLPSYRELASRNPQARPARTFLIVNAFPRTVSPSLASCPASGGASRFLLASALILQQALRPPGEQDARCVRPTSAT